MLTNDTTFADAFKQRARWVHSVAFLSLAGAELWAFAPWPNGRTVPTIVGGFLYGVVVTAPSLLWIEQMASVPGAKSIRAVLSSTLWWQGILFVVLAVSMLARVGLWPVATLAGIASVTRGVTVSAKLGLPAFERPFYWRTNRGSIGSVNFAHSRRTGIIVCRGVLWLCMIGGFAMLVVRFDGASEQSGWPWRAAAWWILVAAIAYFVRYTRVLASHLH